MAACEMYGFFNVINRRVPEEIIAGRRTKHDILQLGARRGRTREGAKNLGANEKPIPLAKSTGR